MINDGNPALKTAVASPHPVIESAQEAEKKTGRLYYLDWLKVGCIALLVPYHTSLIFSALPYHLKSETTSVAFTIFAIVVITWYISLLIFIAGYSAHISLIKRSPGKFLKERVKRLLIPLIFGIFVIVPPQVYVERLYRHEIQYGYPEFLKHLFDGGAYPAGNLSMHHLWFVASLFLISIIMLPVCLRIRKQSLLSRDNKLSRLLSSKYGSLLLVIPVLLIEYGLSFVPTNTPKGAVPVSANFWVMCIYYIYGFMMAANKKLFTAYLSTRRICFIFAISSFIIYFTAVLTGYFTPQTQSEGVRHLLSVWKGLVSWCCITAVTGYTVKYLNKDNRLLDYAAKAFLPVYIVHQTILFIIAYYVLQLNIPIAAKFTLLVVSTYFFSLVLYEFVIRRFKLTRLLFGI